MGKEKTISNFVNLFTKHKRFPELRTENFAGELVYFGYIDNLDRRR